VLADGLEKVVGGEEQEHVEHEKQGRQALTPPHLGEHAEHAVERAAVSLRRVGFRRWRGGCGRFHVIASCRGSLDA
jgi:hypothetical protein